MDRRFDGRGVGVLRARLLLAVVVLVGLVVGAVLVWNSSQAAFTAATSNTGDSWAAG